MLANDRINPCEKTQGEYKSVFSETSERTLFVSPVKWDDDVCTVGASTLTSKSGNKETTRKGTHITNAYCFLFFLVFMVMKEIGSSMRSESPWDCDDQSNTSTSFFQFLIHCVSFFLRQTVQVNCELSHVVIFSVTVLVKHGHFQEARLIRIGVQIKLFIPNRTQRFWDHLRN